MKSEALANAELARLSGLSEKTISKVRRKKANPAPTTIDKIVRALNENPKKLKYYQEADVF
jgi:transcriptional regulator with XRE-family HTH domain